MAPLSVAALLLGTVASTVSAGSLSIPLSHRNQVDQHYKTLARRLTNSTLGTANLLALNNLTGGGYYGEFGIGSPPQTLSFQLDTGSSDTWMNSADASYCSDVSEQSETGFCMTQFDPQGSQTYKIVSKNGFDITYLDGRRIRGDYFNDTVTIDGHNITGQQLGLALTTVRPTGIMGLGFSINVASSKKYPTVVDNMLAQGIIDHPSFSLYLNDLDAKSGSVLFGGIDTAKFIGSLATLPLQSMPNADEATNITSYAVTIKSLSAKDVKVPSVSSGSVAIFDSGSTISLVPDDVASAIQDKFGVVNIKSYPETLPPFVDCAYRGAKGNGITIDFGFDGKTIKVPIEEMAIDVLPPEVQTAIKGEKLFSGWQGACLFGLGSSKMYGVDSDQFFLLGDSVLRSSYVVYDMLNKQIGLAQASLNATDSNVVELVKDAKGFPDVQGVQGPPDTQDNATGRITPSAIAVSVLMSIVVLFSTL